MRIAITGATGNVGSALLRRLSGGEHDLVGVVRREPIGAGAPYDGVEWRRADLSDPSSLDVLRDAFAGVDAVVHLAWGFQPSHRLDLLRELGVGGTTRVLEAARSAGVAHVVHTSSVGAYSPKVSDDPVPETYPTAGVPKSPYSQHKSAAERLLDTFERANPDLVVTRMRPGIVGQSEAGSALLRYGVPGIVPARTLRWTPALPLDRRLAVPMVHATDLADAYVRALEGRVPGAFNLAAPHPVTAADIARSLGARLVPAPAAAIRGVVSLAWHARLLQLDPGWIDLAFAVPLQDTSRARTELGWVPGLDGTAVLTETVRGLVEADHGPTPVLRPRTLVDDLERFLRAGPVSRRRQP